MFDAGTTQWFNRIIPSILLNIPIPLGSFFTELIHPPSKGGWWVGQHQHLWTNQRLCQRALPRYVFYDLPNSVHPSEASYLDTSRRKTTSFTHQFGDISVDALGKEPGKKNKQILKIIGLGCLRSTKIWGVAWKFKFSWEASQNLHFPSHQNVSDWEFLPNMLPSHAITANFKFPPKYSSFQPETSINANKTEANLPSLGP